MDSKIIEVTHIFIPTSGYESYTVLYNDGKRWIYPGDSIPENIEMFISINSFFREERIHADYIETIYKQGGF